MAEPNTSGPASFVVSATTQEGDRVKVQGWFGPVLPVSESDVDQSVLGSCPTPADDGRALVARLDLSTTLESSQSGEVSLETDSSVTSHPLDFVMGFAAGPECKQGAPGQASINFGTMQPQQTTSFSVWIVLPEVITPDDPHPSERTLAGEGWLMPIVQPAVNGSIAGQDQQYSVSGTRWVRCQGREGPSLANGQGEYLAVVGRTPHILSESNTKDFEDLCP